MKSPPPWACSWFFISTLALVGIGAGWVRLLIYCASARCVLFHSSRSADAALEAKGAVAGDRSPARPQLSARGMVTSVTSPNTQSATYPHRRGKEQRGATRWGPRGPRRSTLRARASASAPPQPPTVHVTGHGRAQSSGRLARSLAARGPTTLLGLTGALPLRHCAGAAPPPPTAPAVRAASAAIPRARPPRSCRRGRREGWRERAPDRAPQRSRRQPFCRRHWERPFHRHATGENVAPETAAEGRHTTRPPSKIRSFEHLPCTPIGRPRRLTPKSLNGSPGVGCTTRGGAVPHNHPIRVSHCPSNHPRSGGVSLGSSRTPTPRAASFVAPPAARRRQ